MTVQWRKIEEDQGHKIRAALPDLKVFSCCTDPYGEFGSPSITDEWGLPGADEPILKAESTYQHRQDFEAGQDYPKRIDTTWYIAIVTKDAE